MKNKKTLVIGNMNDIRTALCGEIESLRNAKRVNSLDVSRTNAICNAVGKVIGTVKVELEWCKLVRREPKSGFIELGAELPTEKLLKEQAVSKAA